MGEHVCRRLILFLDGTWNEDEEDLPATSIVYLRERLFWGLQRRCDRPTETDKQDFEKLPERYRKKAASGLVFDGYEYIVYYGRGVGTGAWLDRVIGGAFGLGLDEDIRRAYKFLSFWFRPGDEIFVFGFSRGAFTARSLCGYLHAVGLLRCEYCTEENESRAWGFYRTPPQDRLSGEWEYFRQRPDASGNMLVHDPGTMRVRALGVFDTVGALGIPGRLFRRANRSKYEFHGTDVNSSIDIRLHAMALDEPRPEFVASVWTRPKFQRFSQGRSPTEQVWFPGAHGDVGGGYVKWNKDELGLSHVPLAWMIQRLNHLLANTGPLADDTLPAEPAVAPRRNAPIPFFDRDLIADGKIVDGIRKMALADQHGPWAWAKLFRGNNARVVNQLPLSAAKGLQAKGRIPHADPIGEMIHISAFDRLFKPVKTGKRSGKYAPRNLYAAIPFIAATYRGRRELATPWAAFTDQIFSWKHVFVVDWDGRPLDPRIDADVARVFALLPEPKQVGVDAMPAEMKSFIVPRRTPVAATPPGPG